MASTNQSPFYQRAEQDFLEAKTDEERIPCLEIMIKECPKHKSSENMLRNLKNRLKKLKESLDKQKKSGKSTQQGIKKAEMQIVLAGFTNSGKSTIFKILTEQESKISPHQFTTYEPQLGTFKVENTPIQIIDQPSFPNHDKSLTNSTDLLLVVIEDLDQIKEADKFIWKSRADKLVIFNKIDLLDETKKRKLEATLKSKHKEIKCILFSENSSKTEIDNLKRKILDFFVPKKIIRVFTKEPKKDATKDPMLLKAESTLKEAAEKILKGMSKKIKRARVWGPSSKFGGQTAGLDHILKDKDIIEFQTE